ncbi:MAG: MBL fold metallo-hydrolase [Thermodesulfobacteriota bacterium]
MTIKYCPLASGSKGNALWVETGDGAVLVDAGLAGRELMRRLDAAGLNPGALQAILISHEHRDHVSGAGVLARRLRLPIYLNQATRRRAAFLLDHVETRDFRTGEPFRLAGLAIQPFSVSHDAADPSGFIFERQGVKLGLATDLGVSTSLVRERLAGCRGLILEANHDPQMLMNGPYPWEIKMRVKSRHGHLSNQDAAELLAQVAHAGLAHVVLAHLSEVNNRPELALAVVGSAVNTPARGFTLTAAGQHAPGPLREI